MQKLPKTVNSVTVPTTRNFWFGKTKHTRELTPEEIAYHVDYIETQIAELCGAFTTTKNSGGWYDTDNGVLVRETSYTVWCYSKLDTLGQQRLQTIAESLAARLGQDSVLCVINGQPFLT